ncbi:hypothetical protein APSETT444_001660 [Aspergillus pseudonomiae]
MAAGGLILATAGGFTLHFLPGKLLLIISGLGVSNIFITTNLPKDRQGVAGAVINTTVFVGISLFLGVADLTVSETAYLGLKGSYKAAFWFGVACAGVALIFLLFIKIGKAESDLTVEERERLRASETDGEV